MKSRTKKFSALILILIIVDLVINISKTNTLSRDNISLDNYTLVENLKQVTKKTIDKEIVRMARNNRQSEDQLLSLIIDKILTIEPDTVKKVLNSHQNFINKYVILKRYAVSEADLKRTKEMLDEASDETIHSLLKKSDLREYEVLAISKKKSTYITDTCSIRIHNVFINNSVCEKITTKNKGVLREQTVSYENPLIYTLYDHIQKNRIKTARPFALSKQISKLYLREKNVVGVFTDYGYFQYTMGEDFGLLNSVKVQFATQKMRQNKTYNYIFNNTVNSHYFDIDKNELTSVGKIYTVGNILEYDLLSSVVSSTLKKEVLEEILDSVDTNLLNGKDQVIVFTKTNVFLIRKKVCSDINIMKTMLTTEMVLKRNSKQVGDQVLIETPIDSPNQFIEDFKASFGIDFNKLDTETIIDYYNCQLITLEKGKYNGFISVPAPNKTAIKLINQGFVPNS